jgi:hypothetical protein
VHWEFCVLINFADQNTVNCYLDVGFIFTVCAAWIGEIIAFFCFFLHSLFLFLACYIQLSCAPLLSNPLCVQPFFFFFNICPQSPRIPERQGRTLCRPPYHALHTYLSTSFYLHHHCICRRWSLTLGMLRVNVQK